MVKYAFEKRSLRFGAENRQNGREWRDFNGWVERRGLE